MKKLVFLFLASIAMCANCFAEEGIEQDVKTHSPYFFVQSDDPGVDQLPLLETKANVNIAGVIAEVELTQVYKNNGQKTIEAVYVFPLGVKAAIHAMKMKIGERIIEAKIEERQAAKQIYETARQQGKVASLLEQERPNVFQMNVANIMPRDVVEVTVRYTELLVPESGIYEFVFPTVVGPRYHGEKKHDADTDSFVESPYTKEGQSPSYNFDIKVNINAGMPLDEVSVPSHKVIVDKAADKVKIKLSDEEKRAGSKDFIVRYSLQGKTVQTGILLYPGKDESFFLLMAQPPKNVAIDEIPPREYVFIVDVSGSMHGFPLDVSKKLMKGIISFLRPVDYLNILFFSGGSSALSDYPLQATEENKARAIAMLERQQGGGGTEMLSAIQKALSLNKKEGLSRIITIATDGYVSVEKEVFDLMREKMDKANFFSFGIGSSVNRYIIEGIAKVGNGSPFVVTNEKEAEKTTQRFLKYISSPVLTDITIDYNGFEVYDAEPAKIADLFAERPIIVFGKYRNCGGKIVIRGKAAKEDFIKEIEISGKEATDDNKALRQLWAREKIARLDDYAKAGADVKEEVTDLGLKYSLMTEYTSFVAVDTVVRNTGESVTVKQPLPLPEGISNYAVGESRQLAAAPAMSCMKVKKCLEVSADRAYNLEEEKAAPSIYLNNCKAPLGITLADVEKQLLPLKEKLTKLFIGWELKKATLTLQIENGRVKDVQVKGFEGKECSREELSGILKGMSFDGSALGELEIELMLI